MSFLFDWEIVFQLVLAIVLGALIGFEREFAKKSAGIRTYSLVCLGAAIFTLIPQAAFDVDVYRSLDPTRMISQIVVGIGFIGGGLIVLKRFHLRGLTSAAGLWVAAAIGGAVGLHLYFLAIMADVLALTILYFFWVLERRVLSKRTGTHQIDWEDEDE